MLFSNPRKLRLQYEYSELELEDTEKEFAKRREQFSEAFREHYDILPPYEKTIVDTSMSSDKEIPPAPPSPKSARRAEDSEMRNLFKQIAKETHPDKHATASEETQLKKSILFKKAKKMCDSGDWVGLQRVAEELGIDTPPLTGEQTEHVKGSIKKMDDRIKQMKASAAWRWYELTEENKISYMDQYYKQVFKFHETKDAG